MSVSNWIMLCAALAMNLVSGYFLLKDKGLNETDKDGNAAIKRSYLAAYSAIFIIVNIGISVLFALYYKENSALFSLKRLTLLALLWPLGLIDFKTYRIPNKFIALGLIMRAVILLFELIFERESLLAGLISELIAAAALALASLLCTLCLKNSIGFGDIKLFIVMGLMLGLSGIWSAIFLSLIVAFFVSIVLMISKKKGRKDFVPFAPSIMIGTYLSVILTGM